MAVKQEAKSVPNFTLPSDLSGKLWKSMGITPKKLVCEKEFYERILMVPQQKRTVWECITQHENSRTVKTSKPKTKAKIKVAANCPGSPGEVSTSASMSRKAKLLAGALVQVKSPGQEDQPAVPMLQLSPSPSGSFALEEVQQARGSHRDLRGSRRHDHISDELGWGASGRRGELGSSCGSRARSIGGKRNFTGIHVEEDCLKCEGVELEERSPDRLRIKVRKIDSVGGSSHSGASDRSSKEHCGFMRRDCNRIRSEAESASSSLESDQALALKLHYQMNPRPSRRGQRATRSSGEMPLESQTISCQDEKDVSTQDISS